MRVPLPANAVERLKRLNPGNVRYGRIDWRCAPYLFFVRMHQPSSESILFLARTAPDHKITRVDAALDYLRATKAEAAELRVFFERFLTLRWHGRQSVIHWHGDPDDEGDHSTTYYGRRPSRRNVAIYVRETADGQWLCRVELRLRRAYTCRRYGLDNLTKLVSLDVGEHMAAHLRFSIIGDERAIQRGSERHVNDMLRSGDAESRSEYRALVDTRLAHSLQQPDWGDWLPQPGELHLGAAQDLIDAWPSLARRAVHSIPFPPIAYYMHECRF